MQGKVSQKTEENKLTSIPKPRQNYQAEYEPQ